MMTDPISDMIIRIKNAKMAGNDVVSMPQSKLKAAIADKLKERGILADVTSRGKNVGKTLELTLTRDEDGEFNFVEVVKEYGEKAVIMKKMFLDNGFTIVYDKDEDKPIADGFYFTIAYPKFDQGADLLMELLHYGISAITLETTGSCRREGLRACVSMVGDEQFDTLSERLRKFRQDHPIE